MGLTPRTIRPARDGPADFCSGGRAEGAAAGLGLFSRSEVAVLLAAGEDLTGSHHTESQKVARFG